MSLYPLPRHLLMAGLVCSLCLPTLSLANTTHTDDMSKQAIANRIKPVGRVYIEGQSEASTPETTSAPETVKTESATNNKPASTNKIATRSGQTIYKQFCAACHSTGAAGAPKVGDKRAWKSRLAKGGKKKLIENAIKGINFMPPKGTCAACSDQEIKATVDYMLSKK